MPGRHWGELELQLYPYLAPALHPWVGDLVSIVISSYVLLLITPLLLLYNISRNLESPVLWLMAILCETARFCATHNYSEWIVYIFL